MLGPALLRMSQAGIDGGLNQVSVDAVWSSGFSWPCSPRDALPSVRVGCSAGESSPELREWFSIYGVFCLYGRRTIEGRKRMSEECLSGGPLAAAISPAVVRRTAAVSGRGPVGRARRLAAVRYS